MAATSCLDILHGHRGAVAGITLCSIIVSENKWWHSQTCTRLSKNKSKNDNQTGSHHPEAVAVVGYKKLVAASWCPEGGGIWRLVAAGLPLLPWLGLTGFFAPRSMWVTTGCCCQDDLICCFLSPLPWLG